MADAVELALQSASSTNGGMAGRESSPGVAIPLESGGMVGLTQLFRMRPCRGHFMEPTMPKHSCVSGRLVEVHRYVNVPMRWCEQYPARERRELWIATRDGEEFKLVAHTRSMPARRGHEVAAVRMGDHLAGLFNLSTGERMNCLRADPPLLWRRCDGGLVVAFVAAGLASLALTEPATTLLMGLAGICLVPSIVLARWVRRRRAARRVDDALYWLQRSVGSRRAPDGTAPQRLQPPLQVRKPHSAGRREKRT
jgi:hypothetical protein